MSTAEVRQAAIERARSEFKLPADAALKAEVWVGQEYDGGLSACGTVSGEGAAMRPQRFLAATEPFRWLVFEDAHDPMVAAQPNTFPEWGRYCSGEQSA